MRAWREENLFVLFVLPWAARGINDENIYLLGSPVSPHPNPLPVGEGD
ncbi:MAG: hypothetical protein QOG23_4890 [Blastocatellia bacterium]|jgi:hypothetical protein|nr:hypothetical protein [Blastocatellia bacterium]